MHLPSEELDLLRKLSRPFGHARLAAFFLAVGVLAVLCGTLAGRASGSPATGAAVAGGLAAAVGFTGVLLHRKRVNPIRWRETEEFLARIRRESTRYRALLEGAADMLLVVDPATGRVQECNALARRALGLALEDGRVTRAGGGEGVEVAELVDPSGRLALAELLAFAARGEAAGPVTELTFRSPDGEPLLADARVAAIRLGDELSALLSLRDVTQKKALERELQIRERLSSIGLMTAGVAHDINNPLEGIGNYLVLLSRPGIREEDRGRWLARVTEGFERIRDLARELLRFARPTGERGAVDLSEVVSRARKLASFAPGVEATAIRFEGLERPLLVLGDAARLEQVVFNLLTNAAGAVRDREGPLVLVTAGRRVEPDGSAWIELRVADDGPGIDPADLGRIFDPFFSRTGSAGLGLAVCYATVAAHGGTLAAANRREGGAEFTIRLPAAPGEEQRGRGAKEGAPAPRRQESEA